MSASSRRDNWSAWRTCLVLAVFALLVCVRMPQIIIKGRFWAEEGKIFFVHAWTMPPWQAIWTPYGGYLNLVANTAAVAARWLLPLRLAPYLTIATGLAFQLCPPWLVLTARDGWLQDWRVRSAAVLMILVVPASDEVWLQTLHCQFELMLCGGLILALEPAACAVGVFRLGLLALAPLSGPGSIALVPLFLLRAALDRAPSRMIQAATLGASAALQLLVFYTHVGGRAYSLHPIVLLCTFTARHLAVPFLGVAQGGRIAEMLRGEIEAGKVPWFGLGIAVLAILLLGVSALRCGMKSPVPWLLMAGGLCALLGYFGAIGGGSKMIDARNGERYAYVPQAMLMLCVLAIAGTARPRLAILGWIATIWLLAVGGLEYFQPWDFIAVGPPWRPEVAAWHADPERVLHIWPQGWMMSLTPAATH